ncbi:MAG: sigma-70 family RNA polymerase sigma factor [Gammaproteobacteria bacterium]|jgi:RNA polymerase sigma-70 factor, ECF subfamily
MAGSEHNNLVAVEVIDFTPADIERLRIDMLRFATLQLRDRAAAEDAVQEALSAAYTQRERYAGRAKLKTWVFSILRNKIIDILRERIKHQAYSLSDSEDTGCDLDHHFNDRGYWIKEEKPYDWGQPEAVFDNEQFWQILDICLNAMNENIAQVFMMREMLGLKTSEICSELTITENNCWVILYRARSRLRVCMEQKWLGGMTET